MLSLSVVKAIALPSMFGRRAMSGDKRTGRAALTAVLCAASLGSAFDALAVGPTVPTETLVAAQPDMIDPEYSQSRSMLAWVDQVGKLWVARINPTSGLLIPSNGKGTLVDNDAMTVSDIKLTSTGPEWIKTATGDQLVYTKFVPRRQHNAANARLAMATLGADGKWTKRFLDANLARNGPYASETPGDPAPRISYVDGAGNHYWREVYNSASEELMSFIRPVPIAIRHVRGDRALVFKGVSDVDAGQQVFRYLVDTQTVEQLTFDDGKKDLTTTPWIWQAPEFNGDFVLQTIVDQTELRIYRIGQDATGHVVWNKVYSTSVPVGGIIGSPEPFTYNGKSYVFMTVTMAPLKYPTEIWVSNIESSNPFLRKISDDSLPRARVDPEMFATRDGAYIYFNRFDPSLSTDGTPLCPACSEGIYRAYTGIAAAP